MTQDPKIPPPSEPEDSGMNAGDDVPPWLRDDAAPPPRVRRVTPPPQEEGEGELPPWLAGADEPEKPKTFKIGGVELPEDYFAAAEELPDTLDTEMTFDSWMAEQEEAKREKDIEEEIPDDLLSSVTGDTGTLKQTGQLPDWFLGLEALDTTEAPEWFVAEEDEAQQPAESLPPTWISDMLDEEAVGGQPSDEEDELPSADDISSFFTSIGGAPAGDEEAPDIDWYDQVGQNDQDDQTPYTPGDDFFAQLVSGDAPAASPEPDYNAFNAYQDDDESGAETPLQGAVEIPQNELDAFFDDMTTGREPVSLDDIEDPDLEWVMPSERVAEDEPVFTLPEEPETPAANAEDNADWLGQLENIVASASRPTTGAQTRILDEDYTAGFDAEDAAEAWNAAPADTSAATSSDDFHWGDPETPAEASFEEEIAAPSPDSDWLSAVTPSADAIDDPLDIPAQEAFPSDRQGLTSRLYSQPEPEDEPPLEDDAESPPDWASVLGATMLEDEPEQAEENQPDQVDEFFASEALMAGGGLFDNDEQSAEDDLFAVDDLFAESAAETPSSSLFDQPDDEAQQYVDLFPDDAELTNSADPIAELSDDDDMLLAQELQTGWLRDDLLDADEEAPASAESASEADFFSMLERDADANLLDEEQAAQWSAEQAIDEADFLNALESDQPVAAPETTAQEDDFFAALGEEAEPASSEPAAAEDDFFAALGIEAQDDEQPVGLPNTGDLIAQWSDEQSNEAAAQEDDLYPALDFGTQDDAQPNRLPNTGELLGQWASEVVGDETPASQEDYFASLGISGDDEQPVGLPNTGDLISQWSDEEPSEEAAAADEAFYPALDFGTEDDQQAAGLPNTGDLISQWQDEQADQPEDDNFAALNFEPEDDEQAANLPNTGDLIPQWGDEQADQPEDDNFAALNFEPEDDEQAANLPNTGDLIPQWGDEEQQEGEFFSVLDIGTGELNAPEAEAEQDETFTQWQGEQPADDDATLIAQQPDDFFASLGITPEDEEQSAELPNTGELFSQWDEDAQPPDDFFAALGMESTAEAQNAVESDPFANWDTQADVPPTEDFYAALDMVDGAQEEIPDFFASLNQPEPEQVQPFNDVDSYLASLSSESTPFDADTPFAQEGELDLDALFADPAIDSTNTTTTAPSGDVISGADEDWLAQLGSSVGEVSASAIVRQKEDRPVEELSDRLRKLRASADEIPDEATTGDDNSFSQASFAAGAAGLTQAVALSAEQEKQVDVLKALVPSNESVQPSRISAIDATYDSPFMPELEDTPETTVHPVKKSTSPPRQRNRKRRRGGRVRLDRLIIGLLLAAALVLPFILPGFRIGNLPPSEFAAGSAAQIAFDRIEALQSGELALVGVEYGAASAGELDPMTDAILRHILLRGAFPVVISSNPIGLTRAETQLSEINQDTDFLSRISANGTLQENIDYFIVQFLPGSAIGLRALSGDTASVMLSDIRGQATNLNVRSLQDFGLVTVITDRAEDFRAYAEQIAPYTDASFVPAVSYGAAPLSEPYAQALGGGLLVGFADALSYENMLGTVEARSILERTLVLPTRMPTLVPTVDPALQPTVIPTRIPATPVPTPTPAPSIAIINSAQPANVRSGAGTEFPVITAVPNGVRLVVLGYNGDRTWVNVQLEDGREGWISSTLLTIEDGQASASKRDLFAKRQNVEEGDERDNGEPSPTATRVRPTATAVQPSATPSPGATRISPTAAVSELSASPMLTATITTVAVTETEAPPTSTLRPSRTPQPSATPMPTEAPTEEVTPEVTAEATEQVDAAASQTFTLPPASPGYRDERWYALNIGIIAVALIITAGMVINLVRGLARRGRRG